MKEKKIVSAFVASPSDVKPERELLEEIVKELNDLWGDTLGVYLELVKWETHTYPDIGSDPQSVINEQIGDAYDVFIGILWSRFGTLTPRAESGTVEEFERAYSRHKADPNSVKVMFYFKDHGIPPSKIDPAQIAKINDFRKKLGEIGSLHWTFETTDDFAKYLRMHLSRQIQFWKDRSILETKTPIHVPSQSLPISQELDNAQDTEEEGFLDLVESGTESFEMLSEVANRMTDQLTSLSQHTENNTKEMQSIDMSKGKGEVKKAKRFINQMAQKLDDFSRRMDSEIPMYRQYFSKAFDSYGKAATLLIDFDTNTDHEIKDALDVVETIKGSVISNREAMNTFRSIIERLPRATTQFNRAKRKCVKMLNEFDRELESNINLTLEVETTMKSLLPTKEEDI